MSRIVITSTEAFSSHHQETLDKMALAVAGAALTFRRGLSKSWKIVSAWYL